MMEETVGKAFLREVLPIEDGTPNEIRVSVGRTLAEYEKQARDAETNKRMKSKAAEVARSHTKSSSTCGGLFNVRCFVAKPRQAIIEKAFAHAGPITGAALARYKEVLDPRCGAGFVL